MKPFSRRPAARPADEDPSDAEALAELTHGLLIATAEARRRRGGGGVPVLPTGFGRRLQTLRKSLRVTRAQFSALYGLPEETVKTWETKRRDEPAPGMAAELMLRVIEADPQGASEMIWAIEETPCAPRNASAAARSDA